MNTINPKKLFNSKWTAVKPLNREKHFLVTDIEFDEDQEVVVLCVIEAVISRRSRPIDWRELKDDSCWVQGWK